MDEVLTIKEAAERFRFLTEYSIRRDIRQKRIPFFRVGAKFYLRVSDILRWVDEQVNQSIKPTEPEMSEVLIPARLRAVGRR